ncbi:MAG: DsbA family oxidoreductase [Acidimicrobiales bacterium]
MLVEIWSDVVCPWCYIGKRRFEAALARFEHAGDVEVCWKSFELNPHAPAQRSGAMAEQISKKYGMTLEQAERQLDRLNRLAADEGLEYNLANTKPGNTFDAHRLIHLASSKSHRAGDAMKEALLHAYFIELQPIGDRGVLTDVAVNAGLEGAEVTEMLASDSFAGDVRRDEAAAAELGCTGVPFFVFDRSRAVPGAQDAETLLVVMRRVWERSHPRVVPVDEAVTEAAAACTEDVCADPA